MYLRDDIDWLKRYIEIMQIRYENQFEVNFDIPEELLGKEVPKLFLPVSYTHLPPVISNYDNTYRRKCQLFCMPEKPCKNHMKEKAADTDREQINDISGQHANLL